MITLIIATFILRLLCCDVERYVPPHLRNRQGPPSGRDGYQDQMYNPGPRDFGPRNPYRGLFACSLLY